MTKGAEANTGRRFQVASIQSRGPGAGLIEGGCLLSGPGTSAVGVRGCGQLELSNRLVSWSRRCSVIKLLKRIKRRTVAAPPPGHYIAPALNPETPNEC